MFTVGFDSELQNAKCSLCPGTPSDKAKLIFCARSRQQLWGHAVRRG